MHNVEELKEVQSKLFAVSALAGGCGCLCLIAGAIIVGAFLLLLL